MNIPCPTIQDGSALFLNKVTANGNFIFSMAACSGGLLHPRSPSGKAPRWRKSVTSLCSSSTSESMRRSRGTHVASHSKAIPLDVLCPVVPRYRNLSFFHSFFSDASFTRRCSTWGSKVQVICVSSPKNRHVKSYKEFGNYRCLYNGVLSYNWHAQL